MSQLRGLSASHTACFGLRWSCLCCFHVFLLLDLRRLVHHVWIAVVLRPARQVDRPGICLTGKHVFSTSAPGESVHCLDTSMKGRHSNSLSRWSSNPPPLCRKLTAFTLRRLSATIIFKLTAKTMACPLLLVQEEWDDGYSKHLEAAQYMTRHYSNILLRFRRLLGPDTIKCLTGNCPTEEQDCCKTYTVSSKTK